jgi:hypothetical protein
MCLGCDAGREVGETTVVKGVTVLLKVPWKRGRIRNTTSSTPRRQSFPGREIYRGGPGGPGVLVAPLGG